ncbi:MAG: hypothetical protein OIF50_01770, partial [Flavobacteriaceae bacterium]|nr:hypothetical protein [Flavobacteriaceae bacterium]
MQRTIDIARQILVIALPLSLFMAIVLLVRSSYFLENKALSLPVSIDLLLSIPFLYFLSIRRTKIPNITVVPVMVIGLTLGMYILPKEEQFYLEVFKQWVLPLIEVGVLVYIVGKVRSLIKRYRLQKEVQPDFYQALSTVCAGLFPGRIGILFAAEISMIYYGIIRWNISPLQEHQYS